MIKTKSLKKIVITLIAFVFTILCIQNMCYAAEFSVGASKSTLNIGETTTLTITATDCGGQFKISSSDANVVSVSSKASEWIENESKTYTLTAKNAGTATITVTAADVSDTSGDNEVTGSKTVTITVTEPPKAETPVTPATPTTQTTPTTPTKSSDATLKSITVGGKNYTNPKTDITASNVSSDTSSIKINAQTTDSKAQVTGIGTKELVTGTNKFTLKVTAENGTTKTYTIRITRLAEEKVTPNVVEENQPGEQKIEEQVLRLSSLALTGVELTPEFNSEVFEYTANIENVNEINVEAISNIEDALIEITGNTELLEGENIIIVKVAKGESIVEYKIILNKIMSIDEQIEDDTENDEETNNKTSIIGIIQNWWNGPGKTETIFIGTLALFGTAVIFAIVSYQYGTEVKSLTSRAKHENEKI